MGKEEVLLAVLGPADYARLDEATLDYLASVASEEDGEETLLETMIPLLQDTVRTLGAAQARQRSLDIIAGLRQKSIPVQTQTSNAQLQRSSGGVSSLSSSSSQSKLLRAPVVIANLAQTQLSELEGRLKNEMPSQVNFNAPLTTKDITGSVRSLPRLSSLAHFISSCWPPRTVHWTLPWASVNSATSLAARRRICARRSERLHASENMPWPVTT